MGKKTPAKIIGITGARPNFMKIEPVIRAFQREPDRFSTRLIHTGQQYDHKMSRIFFSDLGLRRPDVDLEVGSGTHAEQKEAVMVKLELILQELRPQFYNKVGRLSTFTLAVK